MKFDYPARTVCQVLDEMRALDKKKYYIPLGGLIEEVQIMANRMEARLDTQKTYFEYRDDIRKLRDEYKQLKEKTNDNTKSTTSTNRP